MHIENVTLRQQINEEMKMAAVQAIAELVAEDELNADYIRFPAPFDARVAPQVAAYVAKAAWRQE